MSRKLVSVQTISRIEPIPGADRIVLAHVLGWKVIISKDMHLSVGDKVAYFETDSLLPESDPRYTQFMPRGIRHVRLEDGDRVHVDKQGHIRIEQGDVDLSLTIQDEGAAYDLLMEALMDALQRLKHTGTEEE